MRQVQTILSPDSESRLDFKAIPIRDLREAFAADVLEGMVLKPKRIPAVWFYDQTGSDLFEQITRLPDYYLTGCEQNVLETHGLEIIREIGCPVEIVEFGSGSSIKTRLLLAAALACQDELRYIPIDISRDFLKSSAERLVEEFERLTVYAISAEYEAALAELPKPIGHRLFLFMGSSIGNLSEKQSIQFLSQIHAICGTGDRLLVGFDLIKDQAIIQAAYNDLNGVTAAFNKNLLSRINRELSGDFDTEYFRHEAPYLPEISAIEMRLTSLRDQDVAIHDIHKIIHFDEGESMVTERCQKYTLDSIRELSHEAGFELERWWMDEREWFCVAMLDPNRP